MHPFGQEVHRTDAIAMGLIATGATMVGKACHLGEVATAWTGLGRVRFTHRDQWDTMTLEFVFEILFQTAKR